MDQFPSIHLQITVGHHFDPPASLFLREEYRSDDTPFNYISVVLSQESVSWEEEYRKPPELQFCRPVIRQATILVQWIRRNMRSNWIKFNEEVFYYRPRVVYCTFSTTCLPVSSSSVRYCMSGLHSTLSLLLTIIWCYKHYPVSPNYFPSQWKPNLMSK